MNSSVSRQSYLGPVSRLPLKALGVVLTRLLLRGLRQGITQALRVGAGHCTFTNTVTTVWRALWGEDQKQRPCESFIPFLHFYFCSWQITNWEKKENRWSMDCRHGWRLLPWTTPRPPTCWGRADPRSPAEVGVCPPGSTGPWCGWGSRSAGDKHTPHPSAGDLYRTWPSRRPTPRSPSCQSQASSDRRVSLRSHRYSRSHRHFMIYILNIHSNSPISMWKISVEIKAFLNL